MTDPATTIADPKSAKYVALAKAIAQQESGGDPTKSGDAGTSYGMGQWNNLGKPLASGELPAVWKDHAKTVLGNADAEMTPENQKAVLTGMVKVWADEGLQPYEIAAKWNSGSSKGWENKVGTTTINGKQIKYDTPTYVKNVDAYYKKNLESIGSPETPSATESAPAQTPILSAAQQQAKDSASQYTPTFAASADDSALGAGAKTLGNLPKSAWNFAKGVVQSLNPVETVKKIGGIIDESKGLKEDQKNLQATYDQNAQITNNLIDTYNQKKAAGEDVSHLEAFFKNTGIDPTQRAVPQKADSAGKAFAKELPLSAARTIVPEAARDLSSAAYAGITGKTTFGTVDENLRGAQYAITNDPFGQVAPFVLAAKGLAGKADAVASKAAMSDYVKNIGENYKNPIPEPVTKYSDAFDKGVSKTAGVVTKPIATVFGKASEVAGNVGKYAAKEATGLNTETMRTAREYPNVDLKTVDRVKVGQEVQSALSKRASELADTGKEYAPVRNSKVPVKVAPTFLDDSIKESAKVKIKNGKIVADGSSVIRDAADIKKLQQHYDFWKPVFKKGQLTTEEFLNYRKDVNGDLAKFDSKPGKSIPLKQVGGNIYAKLNSTYRPQIAGLEALDAKFSPMIGDLKELVKGLVDKEGNLTDAGIKKIANANETKPALVAQLEKISPGIMEKVKQLKAAEDLKAASEKFKVGTYGKQVGQYGLVAGLATMNPLVIGASIAEMILTNPDNAIKLIQKYGKSKAVIDAAMQKLKGKTEGGGLAGKVSRALPTATYAFGARQEQPTK